MNRLYTVYFLEDGDQLRIDYSPDPSLDAAYLQAEGAVLSSPLPAREAVSLVRPLGGAFSIGPGAPKVSGERRAAGSGKGALVSLPAIPG